MIDYDGMSSPSSFETLGSMPPVEVLSLCRFRKIQLLVDIAVLRLGSSYTLVLACKQF